jgi:hypothetical protein
LWRLYYLGRLQGIENKFMVLTDWAASTVFERYTARLDLETRRIAARAASSPNEAPGPGKAQSGGGRKAKAPAPPAGEEKTTAA